MNTAQFDGQQEGERILFAITPHPLVRTLSLVKVVVVFLLLVAISLIIGFPLGIAGAILLLAGGIWWSMLYFEDTKGFITDRRIIRFERMSPFVITKRALFWNEALKAKAYEPNMFLRSLKLGTLTVEPQVAGGENVVVKNVYYAEDLANYIDKILFAFKNTPTEIAAIRPFVPKPKGQRD